MRLIEWQAQRSEKMERQIVGKNNERGKKRGKKRGMGRFIIVLRDVMSSC